MTADEESCVIPREQFRTVLELWCREFADSIFIRAAGGVVALSELPEEQRRAWIALSELPEEQRRAWIAYWFEWRILPIRIRSDEEIEADG